MIAKKFKDLYLLESAAFVQRFPEHAHRLEEFRQHLDTTLFWQRAANIAESELGAEGEVEIGGDVGPVSYDPGNPEKPMTLKLTITNSAENHSKLAALDGRQGVTIVGYRRREQLTIPAVEARGPRAEADPNQADLPLDSRVDGAPEGAILGGHMRFWFLDPGYTGSPFDQGRAAYFAKQPIDANPHRVQTSDALDELAREDAEAMLEWDRGWHDAAGDPRQGFTAYVCRDCGAAGDDTVWADEERTLCTDCHAKAEAQAQPEAEAPASDGPDTNPFHVTDESEAQRMGYDARRAGCDVEENPFKGIRGKGKFAKAWARGHGIRVDEEESKAEWKQSDDAEDDGVDLLTDDDETADALGGRVA